MNARILSDAEIKDLLEEAEVTETEIMQYADGVLPPQRRLAVRIALAQHPDLMQLLESFLFTRLRLADAYERILLETDPERFVKAPQAAQVPQVPHVPVPQAAAGKPRRRLFGFSRPQLPFTQLRASMLAAAAVLLAIVSTAWVSLREFVPPDRQGLAAYPSLQKALDTTVTGQTARLGGDLALEPQLTFSSRHGLWCREYVLAYGGHTLRQGQLACRGKDGVWRVRVSSEVILTKEQPSPNAGIEAGDPARSPLAEMRDSLKAANAEVLDPADEIPLIASGWQRQR